MLRIEGSGSWRLRVRREEKGAVILRALTCDVRAALPDELFGLPVTALGPRAFSAGRDVPEGEDVEIVCGPAPEGDWDNTHLEDLTLPPALEQVGDYGFYGCRALRVLRLGDRVRRLGSGVFTGCSALRRFSIDCAGNEGPLLRSLIRALPAELDITLRREGLDAARLLFPEYVERYELNTPAHWLDYKLYGAGFGYHQLWRDGKLDLAAYDALWPAYLSMEYEPDCALNLAWQRLRYPEGLSERAEAAYWAHIRAHGEKAVRRRLDERDCEGLSLLLERCAWSREALSALCEEARKRGSTEALALLLEARRKRFPEGHDKTFEL